MSDGGVEGGGWDFFVSYTRADREWAVWVAWVLEEAGYQVLVQAWDMTAGVNWVARMDDGISKARRTVAVLSEDYARSVYGKAEWRAAWAADPEGADRKLLVFRVASCDRPGLLAQIGSVDLFGISEQGARDRVLNTVRLAVSGERAKPRAAPLFPPSRRAVPDRAIFPGSAFAGEPIKHLTDPFAFEVHRAIDSGAQAAGLPSLPLYVCREHDDELATVVEEAVKGASRFVVLVGESSTGKTRASWQAVQKLPSDWRLWRPGDSDPPHAAIEMLAHIGPRTVVWLNDAQNYLLVPDPDAALGARFAAGLKDLIRDPARRPVLVLCTLWPKFWAKLIKAPGRNFPQDPHLHARGLLTGSSIPVSREFGAGALAALRRASKEDPRLAEAEAYAAEGQITQYLAGGPALLEKYRNAQAPAKALIDAALDARALGHSRALPRTLLKAAVQGYLSDYDRQCLDEADQDEWFDQALSYTSEPCLGVPGPLARVHAHPSDPGDQIFYYQIADYLEQKALTVRRAPLHLWDALASYTQEPVDLARLARSADDRLLYGHAILLYRRAAQTGDFVAAARLVDLLLQKDELDGVADALTTCADADDQQIADAARGQLAALLVQRGDTEKLQARALGGDLWAAIWRASQIIASEGDFKDASNLLNACSKVNSGSYKALIAGRLASHVAEAEYVHDALSLLESCAASVNRLPGQREPVDAITELLADRDDPSLLRIRAADGQPWAVIRQSEWLAGQAEAESSIALLRAHAGNLLVAHRLAEILVARGEILDAIPLLRKCAQAGNLRAGQQLGTVLIEAGGFSDLESLAGRDDWPWVASVVEELLENPSESAGAVALLRACAQNGDADASRRLVDLLTENHGHDELRARAAVGDPYASQRLADLHISEGNTDKAVALLRERAQNGDADASRRLVDLLTENHGHDELRARAAVGDPYASQRLADLHISEGNTDKAVALLRERAQNGDADASRRLVDLLTENHGHDELRARAAVGDPYASQRLADLHISEGNTDKAVALLRERAQNGDADASRRLVDLLTETGHLDELRARAAVGDPYASQRLADLHISEGNTDKAVALLRERAQNGDADASRRLVDLLTETGHLDELRAEAMAGDANAVEHLAELYVERGDLTEVFGLVLLVHPSRYDANRMLDVLVQHGYEEEAHQIAQFGLSPDGSIASY